MKLDIPKSEFIAPPRLLSWSPNNRRKIGVFIYYYFKLPLAIYY